MNITVPMNAKESNRSWVPYRVRPSHRRSRTRASNRVSNFSYGASLVLFVVMISALAIELVGGLTPDASARKGRDYGEGSFYYSQRGSNSTNTTNTTKNTQTQPSNTVPTTTVVQPTPTAPAPASTTPPAATPVATKRAVAPAEPVVADTAPAINQMTTALAAQESTPVTYTTQRISETTRNRLLSVSIAAVTSGVAMFLLTVFGRSSTLASFASVPRYNIRVREA